MIRALQLLLDPTNTWDKIVADARSVGMISALYLLPLMLLSLGLEGVFLFQFGDAGPYDRIIKFSLQTVLRYELVQFILSALIIYGGAAILTKVRESFHSRHNYGGSFTTLAYSFAPHFLLRVIDGCPIINTWLCWGIGILLSVSVLYRGIPKTLRPEPSNALGLYLFASVFLLMASGLAHYVATLVLAEKILF